MLFVLLSCGRFLKISCSHFLYYKSQYYGSIEIMNSHLSIISLSKLAGNIITNTYLQVQNAMFTNKHCLKQKIFTISK